MPLHNEEIDLLITDLQARVQRARSIALHLRNTKGVSLHLRNSRNLPPVIENSNPQPEAVPLSMPIEQHEDDAESIALADDRLKTSQGKYTPTSPIQKAPFELESRNTSPPDPAVVIAQTSSISLQPLSPAAISEVHHVPCGAVLPSEAPNLAETNSPLLGAASPPPSAPSLRVKPVSTLSSAPPTPISSITPAPISSAAAPKSPSSQTNEPPTQLASMRTHTTLAPFSPIPSDTPLPPPLSRTLLDSQSKPSPVLPPSATGQKIPRAPPPPPLPPDTLPCGSVRTPPPPPPSSSKPGIPVPPPPPPPLAHFKTSSAPDEESAGSDGARVLAKLDLLYSLLAETHSAVQSGGGGGGGRAPGAGIDMTPRTTPPKPVDQKGQQVMNSRDAMLAELRSKLQKRKEMYD